MHITREKIVAWLTPYKTKPLNWVGKSGRRYPYYNESWSNHPTGTKGYANIGADHREPYCYDLPKDDCPYTIEYEPPRLPLWLID